MRSGLLWFDQSTKPLPEKITAAASRYQQKFGVRPDTCFVNPNDLTTPAAVDGIAVHVKHTVMPNYVWLGQSEKPVAPSTMVEPINPSDLCNLIDAAHVAVRSLDRFVQLHDPRGSDLKALENLRAALRAFSPA